MAPSAEAREHLIWLGKMDLLTPDQHFAIMRHVIYLHETAYHETERAAGALLAYLTPYQRGQARVLLPGLASVGFGWSGPHRAGFGHGDGAVGCYGMMGDSDPADD